MHLNVTLCRLCILLSLLQYNICGKSGGVLMFSFFNFSILFFYSFFWILIPLNICSFISHVCFLTLQKNLRPICNKNSFFAGSKRSDGLKPRFFSMIQLLVLFARRRCCWLDWYRFILNVPPWKWGILCERFKENIFLMQIIYFVR